MMSRSQRREAALRQCWLEILQAELLRREGADGGERREQALAWLTAKLDGMAANLTADPDYGYHAVSTAGPALGRFDLQRCAAGSSTVSLRPREQCWRRSRGEDGGDGRHDQAA
jgi:hypothetical protein